MRHFRSSREVWSCRLAACSFILFASAASAVFVLYAFLPVVIISGKSGRNLMLAGICGLLLAWVFCVVLTHRFQCLECKTRPLAFADSRESIRCGFPESRKFRTAWLVIRSSCFQCPNCGESLAVRLLKQPIQNTLPQKDETHPKLS
jgi:hypothetical protein